MQLFAAQVEEAVLQAQLFGGRHVVGHREGQRMGVAFDLDGADDHLDRARCEPRIDRFVGAEHHRAFGGDHRFGVQPFGSLELAFVFRQHHELADAGVVAQIDEDEAAVVADAMHPAAEPHRLALRLATQLAAIVRSESVLQT